MARFEFTMVNDATLQGLFEAGATGREVVAYQMLIRGLPKDRSTADCWMPADMAEVKVGMRADVFTRSLRSLCTKTVVTSEGKPAPILTKISRGCRGHCPHYEDTLGLLIAQRKYPEGNATPSSDAKNEANGTPTGAPINEPIARQKQTAITEFSTLECKAKTDQLEGKNEPIARQTCIPIETRQDVHLVADALLPTAERSVGVSQPHKQESTSERLQVVTETEPARAPACAAQGRTAAALPTFAEVLGKPSPQEAAPFTEADEKRYHELLRKVEDHMALGGDYADALEPEERSEFQEISARRMGSLHE